MNGFNIVLFLFRNKLLIIELVQFPLNPDTVKFVTEIAFNKFTYKKTYKMYSSSLPLKTYY